MSMTVFITAHAQGMGLTAEPLLTRLCPQMEAPAFLPLAPLSVVLADGGAPAVLQLEVSFDTSVGLF